MSKLSVEDQARPGRPYQGEWHFTRAGNGRLGGFRLGTEFYMAGLEHRNWGWGKDKR